MSSSSAGAIPLPANKLPTLSLMLRDDGTPGAALNCESYNPLWLTFADGRTAVVYCR